jgi:cyclophilin family peptidyl-prolyl cis-trans isomerase
MKRVVMLCTLALSVAACKKEAPSGEGAGKPATGKKLAARITTDKGAITCQLFPDKAPKTVESFVKLARDKFFDGLAFHRVIPDFMIQGGDPLSRDYDHPQIGSGGPGFEFKNEDSDLKFDKPGVLAMANAGRDTNGSQFFITEAPRPQLNGGYTIFGQCDGADVVKTIARVPVDSPDHNKPLAPITMRIEIVEQ